MTNDALPGIKSPKRLEQMTGQEFDVRGAKDGFVSAGNDDHADAILSKVSPAERGIE